MSEESIPLSYRKIDLTKEKDVEALYRNDSFAKEILRVFEDSGLTSKETDLSIFRDIVVQEAKKMDGAIYLAYNRNTKELVGASIGYFNNTNFKESFYVRGFAVKKKYQKKGIGTKLYIRMFGDLRKNGIRLVDMTTRKGTQVVNRKITGNQILKITGKPRRVSDRQYRLDQTKNVDFIHITPRKKKPVNMPRRRL